MIILDTDHTSILKYRDSQRYIRLSQRLAMALEPVCTTIITYEEQMRGWLSTIACERMTKGQVSPYRELGRLIEFFSEIEIRQFDDAAVEQFEGLPNLKIGTMDKKLAAIALANNALLLTANRKDFEKEPGLRFENWMD